MKLWDISLRDDSIPLLATAIHSGHFIEPPFLKFMQLSDDERLREEDPFTDRFIQNYPNKIVVHLSRFEVDLNRPKELCIYRRPQDAWGLQVWKQPLPAPLRQRAYEIYDTFYQELERSIITLLQKHTNVVVLDVHSYNYKRGGKIAPQEQNPDINIGTRTIKSKKKWQPLIQKVIEQLKSHSLDHRPLDVRENVKFGGGYMAKWIHERFDPRVCVLSLEFKKIFMDEESGKPYPDKIASIQKMMDELFDVLVKELEKIKR